MAGFSLFGGDKRFYQALGDSSKKSAEYYPQLLGKTVAVCCSGFGVLRCCAVCCSVLHCVAVWFSVSDILCVCVCVRARACLSVRVCLSARACVRARARVG